MNRRVWQFLAVALATTAMASCSGSAAPGSGGGDSGQTPPHDGSAQKDGAPACGAGGTLCGLGETCKAGDDCASTVCQQKMCVPGSCMDGTKDGTETDVDCGGGTCGGCPTGDTCNVATDCVSDVCTGGKCQAPTDTDTVKNDSETDVDCGGGLLPAGGTNPMSDGAPACAVGKKCLIPSDCTTGVCADGPVLINNLDGGPASNGGTGGTLTCQPVTDHDGVKNDSETDVDCGGALLMNGMANPASDGAPPCGANKACVLTTDCQSLVCTAGVCQAPSASDGVKNDSETDTDCGGGFLGNGTANPASDGASACLDGSTCILGTDCVDLVCAPAPVGTMGSADGGPIDCSGGTNCTCQPPVATDGVKNDSETDVDCGGGFLNGNGATPNTKSDGAPVCPVGEKCVFGTDCTSGVCNDNMGAGGPPVNCPTGDACVCQVPSSTDTVQNGGETDVDCGGANSPGSDNAPACADSKKCKIGSDCVSKVCGAGDTCSAPTPSDGVKNGGETDVDCGGNPTWPAACTPTPTADCAAPCADAKACVATTDCLSSFCSALNKTCVDGQSCVGLITPAPIQDLTVQASATVGGADAVGVADGNGVGQSAGIDTCGEGESTDAPGLQAHESCCKSIPMPIGAACSATVACPAGESCVTCPTGQPCSVTTGAGNCQARMDKYEVTVGRVRQFLESVKKAEAGHYNLQAWVQTQLTNNTAAGKLFAEQYPTGAGGTLNLVDLLATGDSSDGAPPYLSIVSQVGGTVLDAAYPSYEQGCFMTTGAYSASTYWWPSDEEASVGSPPRQFTQDYYDIKPINCTPYWVAAAFCAWDGGRLPTLAESQVIYPTNVSYPWSETGNVQPAFPVLWTSAYSQGGTSTDPDLATAAGTAGYLITNYTANWHNGNLGASTGLGDFYFYPSWPDNNPPWAANVSTLSNGSDLTPYISAPGRFTPDVTFKKSPATTEGWMDYGANMLEYIEVESLTTNNSANLCDTTANQLQTGGTCPGGYNCTAGGVDGTYCGVQRTTNGMPYSQWEGGSWEGHGIGQPGYNEPLFTQYGKAGWRCVRPIEP